MWLSQDLTVDSVICTLFQTFPSVEWMDKMLRLDHPLWYIWVPPPFTGLLGLYSEGRLCRVRLDLPSSMHSHFLHLSLLLLLSFLLTRPCLLSFLITFPSLVLLPALSRIQGATAADAPQQGGCFLGRYFWMVSLTEPTWEVRCWDVGQCDVTLFSKNFWIQTSMHLYLTKSSDTWKE